MWDSWQDVDMPPAVLLEYKAGGGLGRRSGGGEVGGIKGWVARKCGGILGMLLCKLFCNILYFFF